MKLIVLVSYCVAVGASLVGAASEGVKRNLVRSVSERELQSTAACRESARDLIIFGSTVAAASFSFVDMTPEEAKAFGTKVADAVGDSVAIAITEEVISNLDPNAVLTDPSVAGPFLFSVATKTFQQVLTGGNAVQTLLALLQAVGGLNINVVALISAVADGELFSLLDLQSSVGSILDLFKFAAAVNSIRKNCGSLTEPPPSPSPPSLGGLLDGLCFSSKNTVLVQGKGRISIEKLEIGDYVQTSPQDEFSRVYAFAHKHHQKGANYIQIYSSDKTMIEISDRHVVYVGGTPTPAKNVKVGDILGEHQQVIDIKTVSRRGLFAPLTENGHIMVSGVRVSSYVALLDVPPTFQIRFVHAILSPFRALCRVNAPFCSREEYTADTGYSTRLAPLIHVAGYVSGFNMYVQWILMLVMVPLVWIVAQLEFPSSTLLLIVATWMISRRLVTKSVKACQNKY